MITLKYGANVVVLDKGQYEVRDFTVGTGESTIKEISVEGSTRLLEKRRRRDGRLDKLALRLTVNYDERKLLHNMAFGLNKATLTNPIEISISEEGELNGVKKLRYSDSETFFDEKEVISTMEDERFYQIDMLFYIL